MWLRESNSWATNVAMKHLQNDVGNLNSLCIVGDGVCSVRLFVQIWRSEIPCRIRFDLVVLVAANNLRVTRCLNKLYDKVLAQFSG